MSPFSNAVLTFSSLFLPHTAATYHAVTNIPCFIIIYTFCTYLQPLIPKLKIVQETHGCVLIFCKSSALVQEL